MTANNNNPEPMAWVTEDTVDGQTVNGKPRRIWRENNEGVGIPIYTASQPAVRLEPVGWQFYEDGKWWHGDDRIKDHRKNTEEAGYLIRDVYAIHHHAEQQSLSHDWDNQDKCRRCGDRDWYASATCTPKQQPAADDSLSTVEAWRHLYPQLMKLQKSEPDVTVTYDLSPASVEGEIRDRLIAMGWTPPSQHTPDVSALVEALRPILGWRELRSSKDFPVERIEEIAREALAAHRKQGDD